MTAFDVVIVGAGLTGCTFARALSTRAPHLNIALVHESDVEAGSNVPGALLHISPGRSFAISAEQADAFVASCAWLRQMPTTFWREHSLVRPHCGPTGKRLGASLERARPMLARAGVTVDVIAEHRVQQLLPGAAAAEAFEVSPAFSVDLAGLLQTERQTLATEHDVTLLEDEVQTIASAERTTAITLRSGRELHCRHVVLACGPGIARFIDHGGRVEGGEVVTLSPPHPAALWSAAGVHGCSPNATSTVVGATRFSWSEAAERPAAAGLTELAENVESLFGKEFAATVRRGMVWRGARLLGPKRARLVGEVTLPSGVHAFVLGGFGATGLLWAPVSSSGLAQQLLERDLSANARQVPRPS